MRGKTLARLQVLEALLLPRPKLERPPVEVITIIEDDDGNIIKGADKLPGGKNCTPGPKLYLHIVHDVVPRPDNEEKK